MGALEGRQHWKGMSANSIIIFRGLNMADCHACDKGFCCSATLELGREEMKSSVSVWQLWPKAVLVCVCVCVQMHAHEHQCGVAACFTLPLLALRSFPHQSVHSWSLPSVSGFQVPPILSADIPRGREGVVEVPLNGGAAGHRQPVPTVSSWSFLHHHWKIPLLQPA